MTQVENDIYTTHLNRRFRKRTMVNAGIGAVIFLISANGYFSAEDASIMTVVGMILGLAAFALPVSLLMSVKYPLRITAQGIVAKYFILPEARIPWEEITRIGIHPKRKETCLICNSGSQPEPRPFAIPWSMVQEDEADVMAVIKQQLAQRGHAFEEDKEIPEEGEKEVRHHNPLKDFWN